jgi:hypothetical protein
MSLTLPLSADVALSTTPSSLPSPRRPRSRRAPHAPPRAVGACVRRRRSDSCARVDLSRDDLGPAAPSPPSTSTACARTWPKLALPPRLRPTRALSLSLLLHPAPEHRTSSRIPSANAPSSHRVLPRRRAPPRAPERADWGLDGRCCRRDRPGGGSLVFWWF